jgi:CheY-like chemotaxis protein
LANDAQPVVVILETDLLFGVRIEAIARAAGARAVTVADGTGLWQAIQEWPALVIIDLRASSGWQEVVRRAKSLPHFRAIPVVAFGSHVDVEGLAVARAAGCDHVWPRSRFLEELPLVVEQALHPPLREIAGCDEAPPPLLLKGLEQFNAGHYWEFHETLEALWRGEPRPVRDLYQGILQIGVAFHHLRERNYPGTLKLLRRGLPRLRGLPAVCQCVPVAEFENAALAVHKQVMALGPERIDQFDLNALPRLVMV